MEPKTGQMIRQTGTGFAGKMVGHFEINMIGQYVPFGGPTFINDLGQFFGNIQTPTVMPALFRLLAVHGSRVASLVVQRAGERKKW